MAVRLGRVEAGLHGCRVVGAVVGLVARFLMPGKDPGGFFITPLLGIGGAWVANFLGRMIGWYGEGDAAGFIASVLGAMLILWIYRLIKSPAKA